MENFNLKNLRRICIFTINYFCHNTLYDANIICKVTSDQKKLKNTLYLTEIWKKKPKKKIRYNG